MSFRKGFLQSLLVSGGFNYASQGLLFFSTVVTSRLLSPQSFGFVGLITVFTGFISIFSDSGITLAIIRSDYGRTYHRAVDHLSLLIGVGLCLLCCGLAYPISLFYQNSGLVWPTVALSATFILRCSALVRGALLAKHLQFAAIGQVTLISAVVQVALTIALAWAGWNYWALIVPQIFSALVVLYLYEKKVRLGFRLCTAAQVVVAYRHTRRTIQNLMGFNLVNYWARNADNLVVGKYFGVADLGIYNRAYSLMMMPLTIITGLVSGVLYPNLKKLKSAGGDVLAEYLFVLKIVSLLCFPVSFLLILFPDALVMFLWGKEWRPVGQLLPYFGLLVMSQSLLASTGNILVLFEKEKAMRLGGWVSAFAMICAIVSGAFFSLLAIVQAYSLVFILFVIPFNVSFFFIKTLRFHPGTMLRFWGPVFLFSAGIWLACFVDFQPGRLAGVVGFFGLICYRLKDEMARMLWQVAAKRKPAFFRLAQK